MTVWRMAKARWAATAFDGEGARTYGGRWNPKGVAMIYASQSKSLAAFENLVHTQNAELLGSFIMIPATLDERACITIAEADLPPGWNEPQIGTGSQMFGKRWAVSNESVACRIPSIIIPGEWNYLLNPLHPEFGSSVEIGPTEPFTFDAQVLD